MRRMVLDWATLVATADVNSKKFWPVTGWIRAADVARLKAIWEQAFSTTDFRACFAYQIANSIDAPVSVTEIGSTLTANGTSYGVLTNVSATTTSAQWVRFGFNVWYNAGGTPPLFGRVGGVVEYGEAG